MAQVRSLAIFSLMVMSLVYSSYIKLVIAFLITYGELKLPGYINGVLESVKLTSLPQDWV